MQSEIIKRKDINIAAAIMITAFVSTILGSISETYAQEIKDYKIDSINKIETIDGITEENRSYIETLENILRGSIKEKTLQASFSADSIGHRLGRNPSDPEFEIAYFFENRFEANISTDLEFPSIYRQRNRISELKTNKSKAEIELERQNILSDLSDKYLELTYNLKMLDFINGIIDRDSIETFHMNLSKSLESGYITKLDYTDLEMILKMVTGTSQQCENSISILTNEIKAYDQQFKPDHQDFPEFDFSGVSLDSFIRRVYDESPLKEILLTDSLVSERELRLARLKWTPKFVVGARLDMTENSNFAPAAIGGLSIPLWENRGNVKHSKAKVNYCALNRKDKENELRIELENLYNNYTSAAERLRNLNDIDIEEHAHTLQKAYSMGRITASEYYLKFYNLISNAYYLFGLQQEKAAYAAKMTILLK